MGRKRRALGAPDSENTVYEGQGDPLLWALFAEDGESARLLIDGNHCSIEATDQLGWRPLHRASYAGLDSIVSLLLERRADALAADSEGVRPLHVAASKGHVECCKLLLAARADPTEPDRQTGMTPQIYAMSKEDDLARQLGEVLGTVDLKLLAAWSNPMEMAKLVANASTEEERVALEEKFEEKFIANLDEPAGCSRCPEDDSAPKIVRTYNWAKSKQGQGAEEAAKGESLEDQEPRDRALFWEAAMQELPDLEDKLWIQEWDEEVLQHCDDVTMACLDERDLHLGFQLTFHFHENPFFTNRTLVKEYHTSSSQSRPAEMEASEIKAIVIDWRQGKDVTVEKADQALVEQPRFSFFRNFFCNLKQGGALPAQFDVESVGKMTGMDDPSQMVAMLMEVDYELGCAMRDQLVPFARRWHADGGCVGAES